LAASWVKNEPTPPAAPTIRTVLPSSGASDSAIAAAVPPAVGSAAAVTGSRPAGMRASGASSLTATYSAYVPADPSGGISSWPNTASPGANRIARGPASFTAPARSAPSTIGHVAGIRSFQLPSAICISIGFIPAAWIAMSTWPGPGCGLGNSVTAGLAPYSLTVIARMIASVLVSGL
jgi:hypothetical protein